ncbi:MAG: DUF983 domain-containing protein [Pseudomonadota bacterium]
MSERKLYPPQDPFSVGLKCRCPRCGEGALLSGLLTVKPSCSACGLDYAFNDVGDGPTVFIIMGLGFLVLGMALYVEFTFFPPPWVHVLLWVPAILALGIPTMRMTKGVLIALTYANDAHQGTLTPESSSPSKHDQNAS